MPKKVSNPARADTVSVGAQFTGLNPMPIEALESRRLYAATPWTTIPKLPAARGVSSDLNLDAFRPYTLTSSTLTGLLAKAPQENLAKYGVDRGAGAILVAIPRPDGSLQRFRVVQSAVMDPKLAAKFPSIHTYAGVGVDDPTATVRLDYTPLGFHAQVLTRTGDGAYYVDPYYHNSTSVYASYYGTQDANRAPDTALADDIAGPAASTLTVGAAAAGGTGARTSGTVLRVYRTAVAATGEYTAYFGGTVTAGQAAIVTAINRVTGIYESELSIRLVLVANNSSLVYTNASTDPYTNSDPNSLLTQNQSTLDSVIGTANYDIGHVFSTAGGGLAGLGVVGSASRKAQGETGLSAPVGDGFYVDYVAHEMGHQFGGNHTFNTANDTGNRNASTAYEPGSGSTIMAYAGIEGTDDLQPHSDPYFAWKSLDEIINYVDNSIPSVGTRTSTGNSIPTVTFTTTAYTIPANTPFTVTSPTATDANGDTVYYSWEEADLGAATYLNSADNGSSPLFRVYNPTTSPSRTFPQLASVLAGQTYTATSSGSTYHAEQLPTTSRTMKFVLTLRDQKAGGGGTNVLSANPISVTSVSAASSFAVSDFNTSTTVAGGSSQTLTWNVAGTTGNGINTSAVNILMSTDGGQTFNTTLAANTANDGSETVQLPYGVGSSQVRFKVAAVGNIFFDINNANLTLTNVSAPLSTVAGVTIDDGTAQRSHVRTATVTFNGTIPAANIAAGAFTLTQTSGTISPYTATVGSVTNPSAGVTVVQLVFGGAATENGSVADGRYSLLIDGSKITDSNGLKIDAAPNGTAGSTRTVTFFRLAGDADGSAKVDFNDFLSLQAAFGTASGSTGYVSGADTNGDGKIDFNDFLILQSQFGKSV